MPLKSLVKNTVYPTIGKICIHISIAKLFDIILVIIMKIAVDINLLKTQVRISSA